MLKVVNEHPRYESEKQRKADLNKLYVRSQRMLLRNNQKKEKGVYK